MNLFSQSQDPGAPLDVELESQCCPALMVDDVIRLSNVHSLYVWVNLRSGGESRGGGT